MIRTVVERVYNVLQASFNTELSALTSAAGIPSVTATIHKRMAAEAFGERGNAGLGVYHDSGAASTSRGGAPGSRQRDSRIVIVLDWYVTGSEPDVVAAQTELAIEAALRCVDRLVAFDATGVGGAGVEPGSFTWEVERTTHVDRTRIATERAIMRFPVISRSTGLQ
jgi:hypothetical protein